MGLCQMQTCCICWICGISEVSYYGLRGWVGGRDKLRRYYGTIFTFDKYRRPLKQSWSPSDICSTITPVGPSARRIFITLVPLLHVHFSNWDDESSGVSMTTNSAVVMFCCCQLLFLFYMFYIRGNSLKTCSCVRIGVGFYWSHILVHLCSSLCMLLWQCVSVPSNQCFILFYNFFLYANMVYCCFAVYIFLLEVVKNKICVIFVWTCSPWNKFCISIGS